MVKASWSWAMAEEEASNTLLVETGMCIQLTASHACSCRCPTRLAVCRYEGEFHTGFAHGLGVYTASNGQTYRGEWMFGRKHG